MWLLTDNVPEMNSGELGGVSPGMRKAVEILHLPILAMVEEPQRIGR